MKRALSGVTAAPLLALCSSLFCNAALAQTPDTTPKAPAAAKEEAAPEAPAAAKEEAAPESKEKQSESPAKEGDAKPESEAGAATATAATATPAPAPTAEAPPPATTPPPPAADAALVPAPAVAAAQPGTAPAAAPQTPEGKKGASANREATPPSDGYGEGAALAPVEEEPKNLFLNIALDITVPMGGASKFVSDAGLQGFSLNVVYFGWENLGIGAGIAFDTIAKKSYGSVDFGNSTFTGTNRRDLSFTPVLGKAYYAWREQEKFIPYLAMGVGAARSSRRLETGYSILTESNWHFAASPEAGIYVPAGPTIVTANARIAYLPKAGDTDSQVFANFSFGISIQ